MPEKPSAFADPDPYRNAPHRKRASVPGAVELASLLRDGWALEEIADRYDRDANTIRQRLSHGGFSAVTGEPIQFASQTPLDDLDVNRRQFEFPDWMLDANCAGTDPELFFPEKGGSTRAAKAICGRCTVQAECLDYGLELGDRFGIFGGLAPRQRALLAKQLDPAIHTQQETA